jgi:hypothetical protein
MSVPPWGSAARVADFKAGQQREQGVNQEHEGISVVENRAETPCLAPRNYEASGATLRTHEIFLGPCLKPFLRDANRGNEAIPKARVTQPDRKSSSNGHRVNFPLASLLG